MRKRQPRAAGNAEDMWFTVPRKEVPADGEGPEVAVRSDEPTYEDTWYQILRGHEEEGAAAEGAGRDDDVEAPDDDAEANAEPQHASSLD